MRVYIIFVALVLHLTEVIITIEPSITRTTNLYTTTHTPSKAGLRQVYLGCFDSRGLPTVLYESDGLTVDTCVESCSVHGYRYAGLHVYNTNECRCGNTAYNSYGKGRYSCTSRCPGDNFQICGDYQQNSVYAIVRYTERYIGCYEDRYPRVLNKEYSGSIDTVNTCVEHCNHLGYKFAGLQFSYQCRCGNSEYHISPEEDKCIYDCRGNVSQTCGGDWHNSVYEIDYLGSKMTTLAVVQTTKIPNTTMLATISSPLTDISSTQHDQDKKTDDNKTTIYPYIGVGVAVFVLICVLVAVLLIWRRKIQMETDRRRSSNNMPLQPVEPEEVPSTSNVPHVEVNGDSYACVVNRPLGGNRDLLQIQDRIGHTDLYMNCSYDSTQATDQRHDPSTAAIDSDDLVYSLAGPVKNDLVVVDNELYGS